MSLFFDIFKRLFKKKNKKEKKKQKVVKYYQIEKKSRKDNILKFIYKHFYILLILSVLTIFSIFSRVVRITFFLIIFMIISALSKLIQEPIPFVVGLDLCLFYTVIVSYSVNPVLGFIGGGTASIIGSLLRSQHNPDTMVMPVLGYLICALITEILKHLNLSLVHIGIICSFIYAMLMVFVFSRIRGVTIHTFTFLFTSLAFNIFLFTHLSEKVASLI